MPGAAVLRKRIRICALQLSVIVYVARTKFTTMYMFKPAANPAFVVALIAAFMACNALAFGTLGHRTIAEIAERGLAPEAQAEVTELLKVAPRNNLADLSTWPDELRDDPNAQEQAKVTARWHYMNFPKGRCELSIARACPDGHCLVPRLNMQIVRLANRALPAVQRAEALGFVVHLFGDLHQPLHLGYALDKGGNDFQINMGPNSAPVIVTNPGIQAARAGANLHSLWDSLIFDLPSLDLIEEADQINVLTMPGKIVPTQLARIVNVELIARESCKIVQTPGFYPTSHLISAAYLNQMRPRAQMRVALAGVRLAALLNRTLGAR